MVEAGCQRWRAGGGWDFWMGSSMYGCPTIDDDDGGDGLERAVEGGDVIVNPPTCLRLGM